MRFFLLFFLFFISCLSAENKPSNPKYVNNLIKEESPYLQQHAYNPVYWYPWGDEALNRAKREHKPIFLSIGYSTCHWCHVMANESFENEAIAKLLNKDFICIKVDREELPHLDKYYQRLHTLLKKRSGGWPLTAILTEDAKPYFVGTYIPDVQKYNYKGLDTLLPKLATEYKTSKDKIKKKASAIEKMMENADRSELPQVAIGLSVAEDIYAALVQQYDDLYYGFSTQPKFPESTKIALLFDLDALGIKGAKEMALQVLRVMALRGLYDQVEGGFFRYSTDAAWEIPHFEKMLYTNAELTPLYVKAYELTQDGLYKQVVEETIEMIESRFEEGGVYYSASDADSDHEEGGYFIYSYGEMLEALRPLSVAEKEELIEVLDLSDIGNFEEKTHINLYAQSRPKSFEKLRKNLKKLRKNREYPFIDKKINTAWNAMMIEALFNASRLDDKYRVLAEKRMLKLLEQMYIEGELYHQGIIGKAAGQKGLLEDYAFVVSALISGYGRNYDKQYLYWAKKLTDQGIKKFYDGKFWYLSDDGIVVYADMQDKYYMAPMNKMLLNLLKLASLKGERKYLSVVQESLRNRSALLKQYPQNYVGTVQALLREQQGYITLKADKKLLQDNRTKISAMVYPFVLTKAVKNQKKYLACDMKQCFAIEDRLENLIKIIESR